MIPARKTGYYNQQTLRSRERQQQNEGKSTATKICPSERRVFFLFLIYLTPLAATLLPLRTNYSRWKMKSQENI